METNEEQVMQEGFLTIAERFERAQRKLEYAKSLRVEAASKAEAVKSLKEQAGAAESEAHALICDKQVPRPVQHELGLEETNGEAPEEEGRSAEEVLEDSDVH